MNARAPLVAASETAEPSHTCGPTPAERPFGAGIDAFGVAGDRERRPPARRHARRLLALGRAGVFAVALDVRGLERFRPLPLLASLEVPADSPAAVPEGSTSIAITGSGV